MKKKNFDDDIRFKVKQRYATISEWAFKTIESERVPESRAKSLYSGPVKVPNQAMYLLHNPQHQISILRFKSIDKKKPRLAISQQSTIQQSSKIYRKFIDPNQITRSLDYSDLADSQTNTTKKKVLQNQRLKKQFQVIHNRMKLILDSYKNRERVLLKYIASLQQEIIALKQTRYQTI
ncbi:unnamed protein product (macronuclear) [Paramecium tetraurelia]|uniref:Uncharacterized protein n=1 Tax=Paramecium tetraurelia TaxID=5888 RepID=A0DWD8_PARTE|nr:uncharacterized protein GSPATT00020997001 [Paramecium tetraurelia]CAK87355.1 unnamed protein product [Paramecium tetraurelia]|eukprot:XP_001454752.1 hypothetical protein (macronuclear) [Paramecium tetraurelia strain d4-2]